MKPKVTASAQTKLEFYEASKVRIAVLLVAEHLSPFGSGITAMASHHEVQGMGSGDQSGRGGLEA